MVWLVAQYSSITIPLQFFFSVVLVGFFSLVWVFFLLNVAVSFFFVCCCFSISLSFLLLHARCSDPEIKACVLILSLLFYFTVYLAQQKKKEKHNHYVSVFCCCCVKCGWNGDDKTWWKWGAFFFFVCVEIKKLLSISIHFREIWIHFWCLLDLGSLNKKILIYFPFSDNRQWQCVCFVLTREQLGWCC